MSQRARRGASILFVLLLAIAVPAAAGDGQRSSVAGWDRAVREIVEVFSRWFGFAMAPSPLSPQKDGSCVDPDGKPRPCH